MPKLKTALTVGLPFGIVMGLYFAWQHDLTSGIIMGAVSAILFGFAMTYALQRQQKKMMITTGEFEGEPLIHQGPANHFRKVEGRGGWLVLTEKALHFRSHGKNLQNQPLDIPRENIESVEPKKTGGMIPNGLRITLKDGSTETFAVSGRDVWLERLK